MASVTVDVSLDEFDLDELFEEIEDRYDYKKIKSKLRNGQKIYSILNDLILN